MEVDGEIHLTQKDYDVGRSAEMDKYFIKVIRFRNSEIEENIDKVVKEVEQEVKNRMQSPPGGFRGI